MPTQVPEKFARLARAAAGSLGVRSALGPFLRLRAIGSPACFAFAWLSRADCASALVLVIAGDFPASFTCLVWGFRAAFKPDRLQSEDYKLRSESLKVLKASWKSHAAVLPRFR